MMRSLLAVLALLSIGAAPVPRVDHGRDWSRTVGRTAAGAFVIGNPNAHVKLVEYLSYTCPHCAEFLKESTPVLRGRLVRSGSTSVELRNAVRDKLDMAAALLARCAGPKGFVGATDAMFEQQGTWYPRGASFEAINDARLAMYAEPARLRALAEAAGLSGLMKARGMSEAAIGACLADRADMLRIAAISDAAWRRIDGTPAFEVDGKVYRTIGWAELEKILRAAGAR